VFNSESSIPRDVQQQLFFAALIRSEVDFESALAASKILSQGKPESSWTPEEKQLVDQVCRTWLVYRQRQQKFEHLLNSIVPAQNVAFDEYLTKFLSQGNVE
jgi:hypothetical protein